MIYNQKIKISFNDISKLYFYIMLMELFIGGAGRLTTFGPLTLRMYFFIGAVLITLIFFLKGYRTSNLSNVLLLIFSIIYIWSIINGLISNAEYNRIIDDAKMAAFFILLLFFDLIIDNRRTIDIIIILLKFSSLFLALTYIIFFLLLFLGVLDFKEYYLILSKEEYADEFGFRGGEGALMYKGFPYVCIGFFLYLFDKKKALRLIGCIITLIAIVLTLTRGLIVGIGIITIPYYMYKYIYIKKRIFAGVCVLMLIFIGIYYLSPIYLESLGDKTDSDMIRTVQTNEVFERVDWKSWLIGHGYGIGVPIRLGHFEITYLELLHKQGVLGLLYWFSVLGIIIFYYFKCPVKDSNLTTPLLFSVLFLYLESASNPFLTNSIGLTPIMLTLMIFYKLPKMND